MWCCDNQIIIHLIMSADSDGGLRLTPWSSAPAPQASTWPQCCCRTRCTPTAASANMDTLFASDLDEDDVIANSLIIICLLLTV